METLVCPGFGGVGISWFSCRGDDPVAFIFYGRDPPKLAVTALAVVPDLEVFEDRVGQFHTSVPDAGI